MAEVKYLDENGLVSVWGKVKGIVTPKADKVTGATNGNLAGLDANGNIKDSGVSADNVAMKDGSYSGMTVGLAEDLSSVESVSSEFAFRVTGGSVNVGTGGSSFLEKIKGKTIVWNQLADLEGWTAASANETISRDGRIFTIGATTEASGLRMRQAINLTGTHKYIVSFGIKLNSPDPLTGTFVHGYVATPTQWFRNLSQNENNTILSGYNFSQIITADGDKTYLYAGLYRRTGERMFSTSDTLIISNPMLIDLTLMFGAGNEPATVDEFFALYPGAYYGYNPGTLVSNAATAIETVGFNQWDEQWEQGSISFETGQDVSSVSFIRTKNYIPILGQMYVKSSVTVYTRYYDSEYKYIKYAISFPGGLLPQLDGAAFVRFVFDGTSYDGGICVNISDPARNGTYEPYWRSQLDLNIPTLKGRLNGTGESVVIFPDGLRSAGATHDEIVGNKAVKRIGSRSYASGDDGDATLITDGKNTYYILVEPEEYVLDDVVPTAMRNDPYGTERRLPADTPSTVLAPFAADIIYATNIKEAVRQLPQNYISVGSMQDFLAALGTQMGGTWSMRPNDNGKFTFTFTPDQNNG